MAIEIGFAVGSLILLAAIIYGMIQASRRNPANRPVTDAATKTKYQNPEDYDAGKEAELREKLRPS